MVSRSFYMQKGKSKDEGNKKTKHAKFSEKNYYFSPPDTHTHVRVRIRG